MMGSRPAAGRRVALGCVVLAMLVAGCDGEPGTVTAPSSPTTVTTPAPSPKTPTGTPTQTEPEPDPKPEPARFQVAAAMRTVRFLAGRIGPREATSHAYARAARWVERRFDGFGYDVERQHLRVPAGVSWGVPVESGRTWNVVARPDGLDATRPYRIVGAHLDTVPKAPGAEDNASGIAVLLELARLAAARPPDVPVIFVAFGAEEPRGDGDALHHFGSRAFVAAMSAAERRHLAGMASLDRIGVGDSVPLCTSAPGLPSVRRSLLRTADRVGVPASPCVNASSDHWSFQREGMPAARVGGTSYAAYHSADDLPKVVRPVQLSRVAEVMWAWLRVSA